MRARQLAGAAAAAVVAAVAVPGALATPAGAATPGYVGIVIAGQGASCVPWHSGITGDEILNDVAAVRYRGDGLILTINGQPTSAKADDTHYWSYWEDVSGSWQYSSYGASATHPAPGTVDGWSFVNGSNSATPPPQYPAGLYGSMCGGLVVGPAPGRTSTHPVPASTARTTAAAATTSHAATTPAASQSPTCSTPTPTPTPTPTSTPSPTATRTSSCPATPTRTRAPSARATVTASVLGLASQTTADARISPVAAPRHHSGGSPWATVIGVVILAVVLGGAGALVWARRQAM